ncbi:MAG: GNAT family N-acetyltransferase [Chitinispirillales bacterium]|nr:GNAT family N-acetyltransferase [Chitinispirillales bacterium]
MEIIKAVFDDLPQILDLQKLAYLSEAKILNNYQIQPLTQTLEELRSEFTNNIILKMTDKGNSIIGSVRAYEENDRVYIGKLIVHPDYQNNGYGTKLLNAVETFFENKTYELYTSCKSERNLYLYKKYGYKEFKRQKITEEFEFIYLEK